MKKLIAFVFLSFIAVSFSIMSLNGNKKLNKNISINKTYLSKNNKTKKLSKGLDYQIMKLLFDSSYNSELFFYNARNLTRKNNTKQFDFVNKAFILISLFYFFKLIRLKDKIKTIKLAKTTLTLSFAFPVLSYYYHHFAWIFFIIFLFVLEYTKKNVSGTTYDYYIYKLFSNIITVPIFAFLSIICPLSPIHAVISAIIIITPLTCLNFLHYKFQKEEQDTEKNKNISLKDVFIKISFYIPLITFVYIFIPNQKHFNSIIYILPTLYGFFATTFILILAICYYNSKGIITYYDKEKLYL
ncbi:MAG: hypothetical protein BWY78_00851 [Alphaproteobacteria bacterium ADurb.Bin438]|nr:MAG: hypothetical protein BWY78_00851 [Alphaproteobacteria bacterium ADurb.Bin438]